MSTKWGTFGRSFENIGNAIREKVTSFNEEFEQTGRILNSWSNSDSILKRLYPSKEDIQLQLIDVDSFIPEIDPNSFDFDGWISKLNDIDKQVHANITSWQDYSNSLDDNQKWIAQWGQQTQGGIRTEEDFIQANKQARNTLIEQNKALQQQTLSAKVATVTVNYCKHNVHKIDLSKTIALYTVSKDTNADVTKKVLVIGDSWTNGATWLHYLVDNFADDSTNLELLGTRPGDPTYTSGIWNGQEKPKHEGRSGWNAYAYCHAQSHNGFENAFWNPDTETFDFSYYMEQQGYDDVDIVIVALGMNATTVAVNGHYPTTNEDSACLKMIVESIKAYNSNVIVGIWLTPPPGQANGDHLILEKDKRLLVNESVIQTFANPDYYNQHVYLIPTNIVMDTTWGYPIGERAVSESVPCASESREGHTETYHTEIRSTYEALHPNYVGNQQVANIVYAYIKLL